MSSLILVALNLADSDENVLQSAINLAKKSKSALAILHVIPDAPHALRALIPLSDEHKLSAEIQDHIAKMIVRVDPKKEVSTTILIRSGSPHETVCKVIDEVKPLFAVLGGHQSQRGLSGLLQKDVAANVIRNSPVPILVVKEGPVDFSKKVLLPLDPHEFLDESFLFATDWKKFTNCEIDLFHVLTLSDWYGVYTDLLHSYEANFLEKIEQKALMELRVLADQHPGLISTTAVSTGLIIEQINQRAKEMDVGLILLPTHARKGLKHIFLGSVAEQIARYAETPVMTYSPHARLT